MLNAVAAVVLGAGSELSVELNDLLSRIQTTARRRNEFVHDTWLVAQTTKREVMQFRLSGNEIGSEMEPLHRNDLTQLTDQILRHIHSLNALQAKIERAAPALLQKLRERKTLDVAYSKRGTPRGRRPKRATASVESTNATARDITRAVKNKGRAFLLALEKPCTKTAERTVHKMYLLPTVAVPGHRVYRLKPHVKRGSPTIVN